MSEYTATDPELIAKAQELNIRGRTTMTDDELRDAIEKVESGDSSGQGDDDETPADEAPTGVQYDTSRPDAAVVEGTTVNETGEPDSIAPNPIPGDAATGDIVSQVKRGEVDGIVVVGEQEDTEPGDVLVSVDPFVTVAKGAAVQELRDNPGTMNKPQRR